MGQCGFEFVFAGELAGEDLGQEAMGDQVVFA
jgi:hypothetical protein